MMARGARRGSFPCLSCSDSQRLDARTRKTRRGEHRPEQYKSGFSLGSTRP
jgi:hypothetical protein